jgi:UTP-glucose-1-phosphate uridylyltransferase
MKLVLSTVGALLLLVVPALPFGLPNHPLTKVDDKSPYKVGEKPWMDFAVEELRHRGYEMPKDGDVISWDDYFIVAHDIQKDDLIMFLNPANGENTVGIVDSVDSGNQEATVSTRQDGKLKALYPLVSVVLRPSHKDVVGGKWYNQPQIFKIIHD